MIFFFIPYILFLHSNVTFARPLLLSSFEISFYPREIDDSTGRFTHRSIWNIIWSCFVTLFACSWVAIHPNVPANSDSSVRRFLRRLMMMAYMLVIPEAVIYWAARQWWAARNIAKKHKDKGWTRTHGFFVSMGGFMLCDENDNMIESLSIERLEELASERKIRWPSISRDEIQDRSKGDVFSKGFAVLQTTWFITQCIARAGYGLTITQLELATLAFSVLNGILYFLWWNKPQDVACPAPVYLRHPSSKSKRETGMQTTDSEYGEKFDHDHLSSIHSESSSMIFKSSNEAHSHREDDLPLFAKEMESTIPSELHASTFACYLWRLKHMMLLPLNVFWRPVKLMATCNSINDSRPLSVPPFYAPYTDPAIDDSKKKTGKPRYNNSESLSAILAIIVGILFGGIHCIAWSFTFQSVVEQSIWRFSAVTITAIPLAWGSLEALTTPLELIMRNCSGYDSPDSLWRKYISWMGALTGTPTIVAYFFSRAALLILPLVGLRSLSPDSLLEISWSSFIPHV